MNQKTGAKTIQILLIEDNPGDVRLIQEYLIGGQNFSCNLKTAGTLAKGLDSLAGDDVDIILLDLSLPESTGLKTVDNILEKKTEIPVVVLTGIDDGTVGPQSVERGAKDYLLKSELSGSLLRRSINYAIKLKKAEQTLKTTEILYRDLIDLLIVGIAQSDIHGNIFYVNDVLVKMFEFDSPQEFISEGALARYKNPNDRAAVIENLKKTGKISHYEVEMVTKKGNTRNIIFNATLKGEKLTAVVLDITERKTQEKELKKKNEKLKKAMDELKKAYSIMVNQEKLASIGTLSAGVAHEILNPLNTIGTIVQVMQMKELSDETKKNLKDIMTQINRATKITNNLRVFAQKKKPEVKEVDIHSLFDKTATLIESDLTLDNIIIDRSYSPDLPRVYTDEGQMAQVFLNLLQNSRDALRIKRREKGIITVKTKLLGDRVEILFSDNGPGIPADIIDKIFDPFFTTKNPGEGTGLGLSMVYSTIECHHGKIRVESSEGEGATFVISLPVKAMFVNVE